MAKYNELEVLRIHQKSLIASALNKLEQAEAYCSINSSLALDGSIDNCLEYLTNILNDFAITGD